MNAPESGSRPFFANFLTIRQIVTRRSSRVVAAVLFSLVALLGLGAMLRGDGPEPPIASGSALPVEIVSLTPVESFDVRRTYTGVIRSSRASDLSFERTAKLMQIHVDEGDRVEAGTVKIRTPLSSASHKARFESPTVSRPSEIKTTRPTESEDRVCIAR